MKSTNHTLRATSDVYWGLGIFTAVFYFFGYVIDTSVVEETLFGLGSMFGIGGFIDWVWYQKRRTEVIDNQVHIYRGIFKRHEVVALEQLKFIEAISESDVSLGELKNAVLDGKRIKKLKLKASPERTIEFNEYDYNNERFIDFVGFIKQQVTAIHTTEAERLHFSYKNCDELIQQDKQLVKDLTLSLQDAYQSVYETHILYAEPEEKERIKEHLSQPHIAYYYTPDHKTFYYFEQHNYLPFATETDITTAHHLIDTCNQNLAVASNRILAYRQLQEKMSKILEQTSVQKQLQQVAQQISSLQEKNLQKDEWKDQIDFDAEVMGELEKLMSSIQQAETADQAEFLKHYISELQKLKTDK